MTAWRRKVIVGEGTATGITFIDYETSGPRVRGECAIGPRKVLLDGPSGLKLALGQYRYGDELIAETFSSSGRALVSPRHSARWSRVQVYLGRIDEGTAAMLDQLAADIRERIAKHDHR